MEKSVDIVQLFYHGAWLNYSSCKYFQKNIDRTLQSAYHLLCMAFRRIHTCGHESDMSAQGNVLIFDRQKEKVKRMNE